MKRPIVKFLITTAVLASAGVAANDYIPLDNVVNAVSNTFKTVVTEVETDNNLSENRETAAGKSVEVSASSYDTRGFLSLMTPEFIKFYEANIAGEKVVTSVSQAKIESLARQLGVDAQKVRAALLFRDFVRRNGGKIELQQLAAMSDAELFKLGKDNVLKYIASLTPKQKAELDEKFRKLKIW